MTQFRALLTTSAILLAACSHAPPTPRISVAPVAATAEQSLAELPTQQLAPGQCALVLWSREASPVRLVVALDQPAIARVSPKGRVLELARVVQGGPSLHGQFSEQQYAGSGISLAISFVAGDARELPGGAVVPSAIVKFADASGWTSLIPAVGLIACQK
jgi:hypothetical protein